MSVKVLIVEDNLQDQKLLKKLLKKEEVFEITMTQTAEEGLDLIKKKKPDIILVDTQLPGMDGFEFCQLVKKSTKGKMNIIIMTGIIEAIDATRAREVGADAYCAKTRDCGYLLSTLKSLIDLNGYS